MQNLEKLEKSKGVIMLAFNSSDNDYVKIAARASRLVKKNLNLPVSLITDFDGDLGFDYDHVFHISADLKNFRYNRDGTIREWKNFNRYQVYDLSPYDETILIDSDYLVLDKTLLTLLEQDFDYRLMYQMQTPKELNRDEMGPVSLPMVWATVVLFRKSERSKIFFDLIGKIQRNYNYYRLLFGIREENFRNDFAFSIANIILNGYSISPETSIPWPMLTVEENIETVEINGKFLVFKFKDSADVIAVQNVHIMDKNFLMSDQFENLLDTICKE